MVDVKSSQGVRDRRVLKCNAMLNAQSNRQQRNAYGKISTTPFDVFIVSEGSDVSPSARHNSTAAPESNDYHLRTASSTAMSATH